MMFYVNKVIWGLMNPTIVLPVMIAAVVLFTRRRRLAVAAVALLWLWMTPLATRMLGVPLEREWLADGRVPAAEGFPAADAIVLLGGGMGAATNLNGHAEMWASADRVWTAARLWRAQTARGGGAAVRLFVTGKGNEHSTKALLVDFGVPTNAMVFVDQARNTEEEAKEVARRVGDGRRRVLLVTSAWHMRRAKLMFEKYAPGVEVVPAPGDFEITTNFAEGFRLKEFLPNGGALAMNEFCLHEWIGYWGYRFFK